MYEYQRLAMCFDYLILHVYVSISVSVVPDVNRQGRVSTSSYVQQIADVCIVYVIYEWTFTVDKSLVYW